MSTLLWSYMKNIKSVENVQRQAARFVKSDYRRRSSLTTMHACRHWVSLASRQAEAKFVMLYRITNNLVNVTTSAHSQPLLNYNLPPHRSLQTFLLSEHHQHMEQIHTTVCKQSLDSFSRHLHSRPTYLCFIIPHPRATPPTTCD